MSVTGTTESREAPLGPGLRRALLAFDGQRVGVIAAEAVFGGDDVGRDALRHENSLSIAMEGSTAMAAPSLPHRHAAHHLDPACDIGGPRAAPDLVRGEVHRLEPGGAEAGLIARPGDTLVEVRGQHRGCAQGSRPVPSTCVTLPQITSSTAMAVEIVPFLQRVERESRQARGQVTSCRAPSLRPLPRGVRIAS